MFPTIFSLVLRDAGTKTKFASSLLIMTIVGGAVAPVILGYIADFSKTYPSFLTLKEGSTSHPGLLQWSLPPFGSPICGGQNPQERGRKPPYSVLGTASL